MCDGQWKLLRRHQWRAFGIVATRWIIVIWRWSRSRRRLRTVTTGGYGVVSATCPFRGSLLHVRSVTTCRMWVTLGSGSMRMSSVRCWVVRVAVIILIQMMRCGCVCYGIRMCCWRHSLMMECMLMAPTWWKRCRSFVDLKKDRSEWNGAILWLWEDSRELMRWYHSVESLFIGDGRIWKK